MLMRIVTFVAAIAVLTACSQPSSTPQSPRPEGPIAATACNDVTPDFAQTVTLGDDVAIAAAVSDLRGGRVAPGVYDLVSGGRLGGATGWQGGRAVALDVSETEAGTIFNWASAPFDGAAAERWTAGFIDAPQGHLTFTCGRSGGADVDYTAEAGGMRLQLPEASGAGSLYLVFSRRSL